MEQAEEEEKKETNTFEAIEEATDAVVSKKAKLELTPSNSNKPVEIQRKDATNGSKSIGLISEMAKRNLEILQKKHKRYLPNHKNESNEKFIYGNYNLYYGYRSKDPDNNKYYHDIRLDTFKSYESLFHDKDILDIGCNIGHVTIEMAKTLQVKSIIGLDIDRSLINHAKKHLVKYRKLHNPTGDSHHKTNKFPFNISFIHGNYVLRDDVLLEIEKPQFDLILCLSITKWIHLNFGDDGLKQAFRRMYLQLRPNGKLILEPQPFASYRRRKKLTPEIAKNYNNIKFKPENFTDYLLSAEVGFKSIENLGVPENSKGGFKRPIYLYHK